MGRSQTDWANSALSQGHSWSFYKAATEIAETARVTHGIEINTKGTGIALNEDEARLLRCFARLQNGVCVDIEVLGDGLSGASVIKADVRDGNGDIRISAASKLDDYNIIAREMHCYKQEIGRLPAGYLCLQSLVAKLRVCGKKGVFFRLLDGYDRSLFQVLRGSDADGAACVRALRHTRNVWFMIRTATRNP